MDNSSTLSYRILNDQNSGIFTFFQMFNNQVLMFFTFRPLFCCYKQMPHKKYIFAHAIEKLLVRLDQLLTKYLQLLFKIFLASVHPHKSNPTENNVVSLSIRKTLSNISCARIIVFNCLILLPQNIQPRNFITHR